MLKQGKIFWFKSDVVTPVRRAARLLGLDPGIARRHKPRFLAQALEALGETRLIPMRALCHPHPCRTLFRAAS